MAKKQKETGFVQAIQNDPKLTPSEKMEFISLANLYSENLTENIKKTSLSLSNETDIEPETWKKFLNYPPIKRIIDGYVVETIKKQADSSLLEGTGTRDAINVRKAMLEAEGQEDNTRYIILRLPDKVDTLDE